MSDPREAPPGLYPYGEPPPGTPSIMPSQGATRQDITAYVNGIVGRGVLLDLPRLYGVKWLEPGHAVTIDELERAEKAQGVQLREGDIRL